jgi:hypothetical protein
MYRWLWAFVTTATDGPSSNCSIKVKETAQGPSKFGCHPRKTWCYLQKVMSEEHPRSCRPGHVAKVREPGDPIYVRLICSPTRFFMIDRIREGEELCEEFKVLGSTGNVRWAQYSICELLTLLLFLAGLYRNDWQIPLLQLCVHYISAWSHLLINPKAQTRLVVTIAST